MAAVTLLRLTPGVAGSFVAWAAGPWEIS